MAQLVSKCWFWACVECIVTGLSPCHYLREDVVYENQDRQRTIMQEFWPLIYHFYFVVFPLKIVGIFNVKSQKHTSVCCQSILLLPAPISAAVSKTHTIMSGAIP